MTDPLTPPTVAIVDDDPLQTHLLSIALSNAGYRCVCHASADALLAAMATERYGVVLADWNLPGHAGGEVLQRAASKRRLCIARIDSMRRLVLGKECHQHAIGADVQIDRERRAGTTAGLISPICASRILRGELGRSFS